MPETNKRDYTAQSKSVSTNSLGPKKGGKGPTNWANEKAARGNKVPGIGGKPSEQGVGAQTKRNSPRG
jgi:hypothetical protein